MSEFNLVKQRAKNEEYKTLDEALSDIWVLIGFGNGSVKIENKLKKENERLEAFIETLQVVHFTELQREKATVEKYEKILKEIAGYSKYEGNQWYEKVKKALEESTSI